MKEEQERYLDRILWEGKLLQDLVWETQPSLELLSIDLSELTMRELLFREMVGKLLAENKQLKEEKATATPDNSQADLAAAREQIKDLHQSLLASLESQTTKEQLIVDLMSKVNDLTKQISSLQQSVENKTKAKDKQILSLMLEIKKLNAQVLNLVNQGKLDKQHLYGSKSQKGIAVKNPSKKKDRDEEKNDFDGTASSISSSDATKPSASATLQDDSSVVDNPTKVKKKAIRPSSYHTMNAAKSVLHECAIDQLPSDLKFVRFKTVKEYTHVSYIQEDVFQIAVVKDANSKMFDIYLPKNASDDYMPRKNIIKGTHVTPELLAEIIFNRYILHVPINRQMLWLKGLNASFCPQTFINYCTKGYKLFAGVKRWLSTNLLQSGSFLHCDESWIKVRIEVGETTKIAKQYIWVLVNEKEQITYYLYDNGSRGRSVVESFLLNFVGSLQSDAYVVYKYLDDGSLGVDHILCMAHARAKFKYAQPTDSQATDFLRLIGKLYKIENDNTKLNRSEEEIVAIRKKESLPILQKMQRVAQKRLDEENKKNVPTSGNLMYSALRYFLNNWEGLARYVNKGYYTIDNSMAERAVRPLAVGRKNFIHFGSGQGARVAALYYSIIETCKLRGVCAKEYLVNFFRAVIAGKKDYKNMLPGATFA